MINMSISTNADGLQDIQEKIYPSSKMVEELAWQRYLKKITNVTNENECRAYAALSSSQIEFYVYKAPTCHLGDFDSVISTSITSAPSCNTLFAVR